MQDKFPEVMPRSTAIRRASTFALAILLGAFAQHTGAKAQDCRAAEGQKRLLKEVVELRSEFLTFLMKVQENTMRVTEQDLKRLAEEERRVQQAEQNRGQQVAQLEEQLSNPYLEAEARPEVEAIKQNLVGEAADKLQTEQTKLSERKAILVARLANEQTQFRALQERSVRLQQALAH